LFYEALLNDAAMTPRDTDYRSMETPINLKHSCRGTTTHIQQLSPMGSSRRSHPLRDFSYSTGKGSRTMLANRRQPACLMMFALVAMTLAATVTTAAAQSTDVAPVATTAPDTAGAVAAANVTQWQFARFTSNFGGGGYSWTTGTERIGDGNYRKFLAKLGLIGLADHPSAEFALLDTFGAQGWELVSCQTARLPGILSESDVTACYFKRPITVQPAANSAP
jgi:hypothetical protein